MTYQLSTPPGVRGGPDPHIGREGPKSGLQRARRGRGESGHGSGPRGHRGAFLMGDNEGQVRLGGNMSVIRALQEIRDAVEGTYGPHKIVVYPGGRVTVNGGDVKGGAGWPEYLRLVAGALESRCPAPLLDWILEHSEEVPRDRS